MPIVAMQDIGMNIFPYQGFDYSLAKENKASIVVAVITVLGPIRVAAVEKFVPPN